MCIFVGGSWCVQHDTGHSRLRADRVRLKPCSRAESMHFYLGTGDSVSRVSRGHDLSQLGRKSRKSYLVFVQR